MKKLIVLTSFILLLHGCQNPEWSDKNVETKALKIIAILDSTKIKIFHKWNFTQRGTGFWSKVGSGDSSYRVWYKDTGNAITLAIGSHEIHKFIKDFSLNFNADTTKFNRFHFILEDDKFLIKGNENGREFFIENTNHLPLILNHKNPFKHFEALSNLKDSLGCYDIFILKEFSNAIYFKLSPEYLLIYLPNNFIVKSQLDSKSKEDFLNNLNRFRKLKGNWILRKLDKPLADPT